MEKTADPVVFIHGMFGWGKNSPLWNLMPSYWPESVISKINPNYLIVEVGAGSSDYDRACETFYQLKGGRVDYGKKHSEEKHHHRYGKFFEKGLYPNWNESNPIHIVGHSFGSTTGIELYQMICDDFFGIGSNYKWVRSITCIAGPLTGTTLGYALGMKMDNSVQWGSFGHLLVSSCVFWWKIQRIFPILYGFYDFRMPQWSGIHDSWTSIASIYHPLSKSEDNVCHCLVPGRRIVRNSTLKHMDKIFLISIVSKQNASFESLFSLVLCFLLPWLILLSQISLFIIILIIVLFLLVLRLIDISKLPVLATTDWIFQIHCKSLPQLFEGFDNEMWLYNDGIVNTMSMICPWHPSILKDRKNKSKYSYDIDNLPIIKKAGSATKLKKGEWKVFAVEKNHFCGTSADKTSKDLYNKLFCLLNSTFTQE